MDDCPRDVCGERRITIHAVAKCPKMKKGPRGDTGRPGDKGDTGRPGEKGEPGHLVELWDEQFFLAKWFSKNATSADPDRSFSDIYLPLGLVHLKTWAMEPSSTKPRAPIACTIPFSPFRTPGSNLIIKVHCLTVKDNNRQVPINGWVRLRLDREVIEPHPDVPVPMNEIGVFVIPPAFSDELFVQEPPAHINPLRRTAYHYVFTFQIPVVEASIPYARFFVSFERSKPDSGPEYPDELQFEYIQILYRREYSVDLNLP